MDFRPTPSHSACSIFYRDVMVYIPGISALCIFLTLLTIDTNKLGQRAGQLPSAEEVAHQQENSSERSLEGEHFGPYVPLVNEEA